MSRLVACTQVSCYTLRKSLQTTSASACRAQVEPAALFLVYSLIFIEYYIRFLEKGWDKSPNLSIVFGLSSKTQWLSGLYYADFISFYSPTQLCGGGTTKSNSNELPISVPLSFSCKFCDEFLPFCWRQNSPRVFPFS